MWIEQPCVRQTLRCDAHLGGLKGSLPHSNARETKVSSFAWSAAWLTAACKTASYMPQVALQLASQRISCPPTFLCHQTAPSRPGPAAQPVGSSAAGGQQLLFGGPCQPLSRLRACSAMTSAPKAHAYPHVTGQAPCGLSSPPAGSGCAAPTADASLPSIAVQ